MILFWPHILIYWKILWLVCAILDWGIWCGNIQSRGWKQPWGAIVMAESFCLIFGTLFLIAMLKDPDTLLTKWNWRPLTERKV